MFFSTANRLGIDDIFFSRSLAIPLPLPLPLLFFFSYATAVASSTFDSLRLRRTAQFVVGHLICFWNSRNINKNGEFMGITILLLDELAYREQALQDQLMQAKDSVSTMQKLHELAQSQLFELRVQLGCSLTLNMVNQLVILRI
ncbi:hypothetical protein Rs2_41261 [Raphanus sativus]|nr:hypothetical protein Rs2_41261 [Raphanus sativus]